VVSALVTDVINPILSVALGAAEGLKTASLKIGPAKILYGDFISAAIDFLVIALVVYFGVKILGVEVNKKK
jgi:large conductance mechanosensitive channel